MPDLCISTRRGLGANFVAYMQRPGWHPSAVWTAGSDMEAELAPPLKQETYTCAECLERYVYVKDKGSKLPTYCPICAGEREHERRRVSSQAHHRKVAARTT